MPSAAELQAEIIKLESGAAHCRLELSRRQRQDKANALREQLRLQELHQWAGEPPADLEDIEDVRQILDPMVDIPRPAPQASPMPKPGAEKIWTMTPLFKPKRFPSKRGRKARTPRRVERVLVLPENTWDMVRKPTPPDAIVHIPQTSAPAPVHTPVVEKKRPLRWSERLMGDMLPEFKQMRVRDMVGASIFLSLLGGGGYMSAGMIGIVFLIITTVQMLVKKEKI